MDTSDLSVLLNFIKLKRELEEHKRDDEKLLLLITHYSKMGLYTSSTKTKDDVIKTLYETTCKVIQDRANAINIMFDETVKLSGALIKFKSESKRLKEDIDGLTEDSEDME